MLHVIEPVVAPEMVATLPHAVLADVRWYLDGRDGRAAFEQSHLPGAVWVDLDRQLAGHGLPATEGRHPLPTPDEFAASMGELGIGDGSVVIAYDDTGGLTAGRLVVMLRMLGRDAAILDGGLAAWVASDHPVEAGAGLKPTPAVFTAQPWPADRLASADETAAHAAAGRPVLDARAHERFTGEQALIDPRPGHVPGARSAPWSAVLGADGRLRPTAALRAHYVALGVATPADGEGDHGSVDDGAADADRGAVLGDDGAAGAAGAIASCGSGVSACMNILAMEHAGLAPARLYVASWSGWSADPARPAEQGDPWADGRAPAPARDE